MQKGVYVLVAEPVDPLISDRKIEIYPFLLIQRGVAGQVVMVGERRGGGLGGMENMRKRKKPEYNPNHWLLTKTGRDALQHDH